MSQSLSSSSRWASSAIALFFALFFILGIFIFRDYGVSADDNPQHYIGLNNFNYITGHNKNLLKDTNRDYGPIFEIILVSAEKIIDPVGHDWKQIFLTRHLGTFLAYYAGVFFFFLICRKRFRDPWVSLLGCLMLIASPCIFANAFFNSKDIPFMAMTIIAVWSSLNFLEKPSFKRAAICAFCCALSTDIRIGGILIVAITAILFLGQVLVTKDRRTLMYLTAYLVFSALAIILLWPILWHDPVNNFLAFLKAASHFTRGPGRVFYNGHTFNIHTESLPWHYLFFWMGVTIPATVLVLFILGFVRSLYVSSLRFKETLAQPFLLFVFLWLLTPLVLVIAMKAIVYNGWRHMFFIYPSLVLLALEAVSWLRQKPALKNIATVVIFVAVGSTLGKMISLHPFEHGYVNELVAFKLDGVIKDNSFDLAQTNYKNILERILKTDPAPIVKVYGFDPIAFERNKKVLEPDLIQRLIVTDKIKEADYAVMEHPANKEPGELAFVFTLEEAPMFWIYKLMKCTTCSS